MFAVIMGAHILFISERAMSTQNRATNQLRDIKITRQYLKHAEGSVLVEFGDTKVICTASITNDVPPFLKNKGTGWVTAEYGMLPRSTHDRMQRESAKGKQTGRTQEIQRLIGRSLRNAVDMSALGERTIALDCDVIQADGGTRTASITGACVALRDALDWLVASQNLTVNPFKQWVASVSVGIIDGQPMLDLDYKADSNADTDMNVVMAEDGGFIEIQGTAEKATYSDEELATMLSLAKKGISELITIQKKS